ncbi:MAG: transmembrane 220 family protein [Pseudomonadota bacterium]
MRILNGVLACVLILFAVVQYNDPDGVFWAVVYGVGVIWCAVAAFRAGVFTTPVYFAYLACFAAGVAGVVWFWPRTPNFWLQDVWWETETAREGMGMMILFLCLVAAGIVARKARRA